MSDRLFFSLCGIAAALMLALALVWPQGLGARSPPPFGHAVEVIKGPPPKVKPPKPPKVKRPKGPPKGSL